LGGLGRGIKKARRAVQRGGLFFVISACSNFDSEAKLQKFYL
jgi:hypothetical protein